MGIPHRVRIHSDKLFGIHFTVVDKAVNFERTVSLKPPGGVGFSTLVSICMAQGVTEELGSGESLH